MLLNIDMNNFNLENKSYDIKSLRERLILHNEIVPELHVNEIEYTPAIGGKDQHDGTWMNGNNKVIVEIKIRHSSFDWPTYVIEEKKYRYLMSRADEFDEVYYICAFSDAFVIWDLKLIPPLTFGDMVLQNNNEANEYETKDAEDLKTKDALFILHKKIDIFGYLDKGENIYNKRYKEYLKEKMK